MTGYYNPAIDRAVQAHAHATTPAPPRDLTTVTTPADFDALSPTDRNRLFIEDPARYRALRDSVVAAEVRRGTFAAKHTEQQAPPTDEAYISEAGITDKSIVQDAGRTFAYELAAFVADPDPEAAAPGLPDLGGGEMTTSMVVAAALETFTQEIIPGLLDAAAQRGVRLQVSAPAESAPRTS